MTDVKQERSSLKFYLQKTNLKEKIKHVRNQSKVQK
jgi:hypothetical protein